MYCVQLTVKNVKTVKTEMLASLDDFGPLQWCGDHANTYRLLSDIASILLIIQMSSSECELHFSALIA